nr:hypothetical protein [Streptomyces arboris]
MSRVPLVLRIVELPIQVFPRPCEGAQSFIDRLATANYLKPGYLHTCLCDPPRYRGTLSWSRLAAATGRDPLELREVLERTPPPPPDLLLEQVGVAIEEGAVDPGGSGEAGDGDVPAVRGRQWSSRWLSGSWWWPCTTART